MPLGIAILIVGSVMCMVIARLMATRRDRSPGPWMLWAALFGPLPLAVLAFVPAKRGNHA